MRLSERLYEHRHEFPEYAPMKITMKTKLEMSELHLRDHVKTDYSMLWIVVAMICASATFMIWFLTTVFNWILNWFVK